MNVKDKFCILHIVGIRVGVVSFNHVIMQVALIQSVHSPYINVSDVVG